MTTAAAKTEVLEAQLYALENEQAELRKLLNCSKEGERLAVARWKKAERSLSEMVEQLERMEREHRMEKARAQNLLDRLEKRQLADRKSGLPSALVERTAMSQFMKEVLAENNHLQSGIAELRDMLIVSQEEVCALREQLMLGIGKTENDDGTPLSRELLAERLQTLGLPTVAPELHFHHHYHKEKGIRRMKKRRGVALPEHLRHASKGSIDGTSAPMSPGPSGRTQRWSQISNHTRSSSGRVPSYSSSPQSTFTWRDSLIFDRSTGPDSTRPSTPDSEYDVPITPNKTSGRYSRHRAQGSINPPFSILYTDDIPEENGEEDGSLTEDTTQEMMPARPQSSAARSILRRSASHESLLSPTAIDSPSSHFPVSPAIASFKPVSPLAMASTSPNSIVASHKPTSQGGSGSSVAYNHLLLAGGAIRGKSPRTSLGSSVSKAGWLWSWGTSMVRGESSAGNSSAGTSPSKTPAPVDMNDTTPTASSVGGAFPTKKRMNTFPIGTATPSTATATTSATASIKSTVNTADTTPVGTMSKNSTVQPIAYRSFADQDLLRESLMEGFQG